MSLFFGHTVYQITVLLSQKILSPFKESVTPFQGGMAHTLETTALWQILLHSSLSSHISSTCISVSYSGCLFNMFHFHNLMWIWDS